MPDESLPHTPYSGRSPNHLNDTVSVSTAVIADSGYSKDAFNAIVRLGAARPPPVCVVKVMAVRCYQYVLNYASLVSENSSPDYSYSEGLL